MTNPEGLTWAEWAYAAGIPEPGVRVFGLPAPHRDPTTQTFYQPPIHRAGHERRGYAYLFRKERKAWRQGEDPSEWRNKAPRS